MNAKRLYSAGTALEAHDLRFCLAARGIEAKVFGDNNAWEGAFAFTPESAPGVFVDEADLDAAGNVLEEFLNRPRAAAFAGKWTCPNCKQRIEAQFDQCWNCESPRGDAPIETASIRPREEEEVERSAGPELQPDVEVGSSSPLRRKDALFGEVLVIVALTAPVFGGYSIPSAVLHAFGMHSTAGNFFLPRLLANAFIVAVTIFAIRRSGEPWANFGITSPDWLDVLGAVIVYLAARLTNSIGMSMLFDYLRWMYGTGYLRRLSEAHVYVVHAPGFQGLIALLLRATFVGVAEELVMRGYLIPRLERMLRSTWAAVLASAALFGVMHLHFDFVSASSAFLAGLVYGVAFAWSRRLWPVAIAHSLQDFSALLYYTRVA